MLNLVNHFIQEKRVRARAGLQRVRGLLQMYVSHDNDRNHARPQSSDAAKVESPAARTISLRRERTDR